ncbi:MAG: nucleotidyl transferase AbiEii/AbiGii toxin family protein [Pseudomonadota bacterium]
MTINLTESIKQRLLNYARAHQQNYNFVLRQYVLQRSMYRLGASEYAHDFLLKGGLLFWVWQQNFHRPTQDMDLLGFGSDDIDILKAQFLSIIQVACDDGVEFKPGELTASTIKADAKYQGVRITGKANLHKTLVPYQIDIGSGDAVPSAATTVFLSGVPAPTLKVYPLESVIAEKFHAMVVLGFANSRMKDFFDIVTFASTLPLESLKLQVAIAATFTRRNTRLDHKTLELFSAGFKADRSKQIQWQAFITKNKLATSDSFALSVEKIEQLLEPICENLTADKNMNKTWDAKTWSWK